MSIPVPLDRLRAAIAERSGAAYLLTVGDDGRPHAVHVALAWDGDDLAARVGGRTAANAEARPGALSLVYPVRGAGDYSLIVDGRAAVSRDGEALRLRFRPTGAVLHRPAAAVPDPASPCAADCVPLLPRGREKS